MKTIHKTFNVYSYAELSEPAKEKAIEELAYVNVEDTDILTDDDAYSEIAKEYGLEIDMSDACYDLDRGSFLYFDQHNHGRKDKKVQGIEITDYKTFVKKAGLRYGKKYQDEMSFGISTSHYGGGDGKNDIISSELSEEVEEKLQTCLNKFLQTVLNQLKDSYNYLVSEESIIETIDANEWSFYQDGKLYGSVSNEDSKEKLVDWNELTGILVRLSENRGREISRHANGLIKALKL